MAATLTPSSSDPFLSQANASPPKARKMRPASISLTPVPPFSTGLAISGAAKGAAPRSPAPFVGTAGSSAWPASGPTVPPSPLQLSLNSPFWSGLATPSKDAMRSPLSPLRYNNEEEAGDYGFPSAAVPLSARSASSDRLSPYSAVERKLPPTADRKSSQHRSKLHQLFGKGPDAAVASPAGYPFPATPPLTPPYTTADSNAPRMPPSLTPLTTAGIYAPLTPPPSASPVGPPSETSSSALATHQLHPRFAREYRILGELGSGGFGFVVRAIRLADKRIVAVKFIAINKVPSHAWVKIPHWDGGNRDGTRGGEALIPMEAFVLRRVKHDGVVGFIDLFEHDPYFYLVMEHHGTPWVAPEREKQLTSPSTMPALAAAAAAVSAAFSSVTPSSPPDAQGDRMQLDHDGACLSSSPTPMSRMEESLSPPAMLKATATAAPPMLRRASCDLFECIEQHKRLPEDTARFVFRQICEAVHHLLLLGICHRDIKDENIVCDKLFRVKLIDFGSAVIHDPRQPPPYYNRFWGTMNFASAEILASQPYRAPQAEVWALGVLLCLLVSGETPFASVERAREGRPTVNLGGVSRSCCDLIMRCLIVDPDERITVEQMLQHPWLAGHQAPASSLRPLQRSSTYGM